MTTYYRQKLDENGFDVIPGTHPCVPVMLYDEKTAAGLVKKVIADLKENDLLLQDRDTTCKKFLGVRHLCISLYALKGYMSVRTYGKKEE